MKRTGISRRSGAALACAVVLGLAGTACGTGSWEQPQIQDSFPVDGAAEPAPAQSERSPADTTAEEVRAEVITTGSATVRTGDPEAAATSFTATVTDQGGRIASSETSTRSDQLRAVVTARVPAAKYQTVVDSLADHGEVVAQSTQSTDVGQERVDLEARRQALQTSVDRLTELMSSAGSVEDLLAAENTLTQRQADLDALTAQLDYLADQVALSTLTVTFTVDDDGYRPPNAFERAWAAFVTSLESVLIVSLGLLPWLVILAALIALAFVLVRRRRRRTRPPRDEG
jgi:polyhydroxyalkanoate synthesis regulator phasin